MIKSPNSVRKKPSKKSARRTAKKVTQKRNVIKKGGKASQRTQSVTLGQVITRYAQRLSKAKLYFGHGSDNAFDEAAELVIYACGFRHQDAPAIYSKKLTQSQRESVLELVNHRIKRRIPAAYLTHRMWFAGHEFYVDERVLVPRSPIAELIQAKFAPWIDASKIKRVLDIGTGSGCIAIATALALPHAQVDAADVSVDALAVTKVNIGRHKLRTRVRMIQSNVFGGLNGKRYDLIVSNPPYVSAAEVRDLPKEYRHEPQLGLLAGDDGLSVVRVILAQAEQHLAPRGVLIVEVGNTEDRLQAAYPRVPFMWLEFEHGGGGVFVLTAEQLREHRRVLRVA
jgi:ribosomal protein L3 glutamine methyltransferase